MGKRILVADPDSVVQQVASYFLKLEGFEVETAGDGASAMEAIEKAAPDVIVVTPDLPGINGVEVSHFVLETPKYKAIPIIFLAESEEPLLRNIPGLSQKFGIVNKPVDPTQFVNVIKEYLGKGSVPAEGVAEPQKSIEELLGWGASESKAVQFQEEVFQEKPQEKSFDVNELLSCGLSKVDENPAGHTEPYAEPGSQSFSGSHGEEILKQVRDEGEEGISCEAVEVDERESETAECVEADLKSRVTDEMIEDMVRKIAVDIVERVAREIVPDIAEREITKEIERLKGTE